MCIPCSNKRKKDDQGNIIDPQNGSPTPRNNAACSTAAGNPPNTPTNGESAEGAARASSKQKSGEEGKDTKKQSAESVGDEKRKSEKVQQIDAEPKLKPVSPPKTQNAKREPTGKKDAKDPAYATLDGDYPSFKAAALTGGHRSIDKTQASSKSAKEVKQSE